MCIFRNKFDFILVAGSTIDSVLAYSDTNAGSSSGFLTSLRTFRLARLLRLIKRAKVLSEIISGLYFTALGLINVFAMLFLLIFVYTIMGVQVSHKQLHFCCSSKALHVLIVQKTSCRSSLAVWAHCMAVVCNHSIPW